MADNIEVLYRDSRAPEDPEVKWRGFQPGRTVLAAGSTHSPEGRPLACDIVLDRDVEMRLSDGTRIFLDVYRPDTDEPLPAVLAWSPYEKQGGFVEYDVFPGRGGVAPSATSGLEKFEGPDPAFWCANGYAVVHVDPRGSFASEGDVQVFSPLEAQDGHDVVEWVAAQDWCADAVAMAGNSWLAVTQWMIAATRPPHLAAIAPWEGFTDVYRDYVRWGGILRLGLAETLTVMNAGRGRIEDLPGMARKYPLMNDYWRSKITDVEAVAVPAYVVASWTNSLHTRGTLEAFTRLDPSRSWLRVHNTMEWPDQYAYEDDLLAFFDHVIKGKDNGWQRTPRVRLSVLDPGGTDQVDRPEDGYPLARARETALHLDAGRNRLSASPPSEETHADYQAETGTLTFDHVIDRDIEIVGPMKLRVWLEVDTGTDASLFVYVRKADADGQPLLSEVFEGMPCLGAHGRLRASHRELDPDLSTALSPVCAHEREQPLRPGEAVQMDIAVWPHGMALHAGERLQVVISGHDLEPELAALEADAPAQNSGTHRIHTGGAFDSHLLVPIVTAEEAEAPAL
ncbi:CocE/NonD family hydrolase [Actinomadura nitritigenes]|uniref:CocE/NonD family hydrolase n=1 Tax=Actinomadura nitritigenes TaxID=134602 RepID=UPI003D8C1E7A